MQEAPAVLLDHLIGLHEERGWNVDGQRPGSPQVDGEFELGWILDRHFTRWRATQKTGDEVGDTPLERGSIWPVADQTAVPRHVTPLADGRHPGFQR